jgi:helicase
VAKQAQRVDTLFLHGSGDDYLVVATRDDERLFRAVLEVRATDAGPRPARLRIMRGAAEEPRPRPV